MLVRMDVILKEAQKGLYGVPAPNVTDPNCIKWCMEAAREVRSPVIIDSVSRKWDIEETADMVKYYSRKFPEVPVVLNLDHGNSFEQAALAIKYGYTSVMVDKSKLPDDENIAILKEVVRMSHAADVSVEGEIGHVGQGHNYEKERDQGLTSVEQAVRYVKETGVDCLAVAVGTSHGAYVGTPEIDFDRVVALRNAVDTPLVIHGASYTGDEKLIRCAQLGCTKFNVFAELTEDAMRNGKEFLAGEYDSRNFYELVQEMGRGYKDRLIHYMQMLGSANRW